jgi:NAD(P)-dependent dehydrogenase (short-subunit alcohol dehydrogenase family)
MRGSQQRPITHWQQEAGMDLHEKIVLITGAGKGAGSRLARIFAEEGARVAVNDVSPVNLDKLVRDRPGRIRAYPEDIAKKVGVQTVIKQVEDDLGPIDILINNAAIEPHVSLLDMDEWDWHRVLDVNLTGTFLAIQSVGRTMKEHGSGIIINWVDLDSDWTRSAAYATSMYGLIALTQAASAELSPHGVFVHAAGRGIDRLQGTGAPIPAGLRGAILYLCDATRSGQIINVEEL